MTLGIRVTITALGLTAGLGAGPVQEPHAAADAALAAGQFATADQLYRSLPDQTIAIRVKRARLALWGNRHADVDALLVPLRDDGTLPRDGAAVLAESCYRRDDFVCAAAQWRAAGQDARAELLESFGRARPYHVTGPAQTTLPFVVAEPLPVVTLTVDGREPIHAIIDTGAADLILDTEYAREIGLRVRAAGARTFAGDQQAEVSLSRVASVGMGELTVHDVPVTLLPTRRFAAAAGGRRVDAIIGTVLLYHFVATLDYPASALILRERGASVPAESSVPFWMAGSHLMVAWGSLNQAPHLMLIDTGLAGMGFAAPKSTIEAAGIALNPSAQMRGQGGGGQVSVIPFVAESITLGPITRHRIAGVAGAFPESLERSQGFRIGGLVSHAFFRPYAVTFDFERMQLGVTGVAAPAQVSRTNVEKSTSRRLSGAPPIPPPDARTLLHIREESIYAVSGATAL